MTRAAYPARIMRLLDRYLFRELLTPLAYCLGGFLVFWISFNLFSDLDKLQDAKLRLLDVIEYSMAMTPEFLVTILPVTLLLGLLYTLTNHARHNEITAIRAAGVGLFRLCVPYWIVGLVAGAALFALNEWCVPVSTAWADRILDRYLQKSDDPGAQNQVLRFKNRTWRFSDFHPGAAEVIDPKIIWDSSDGSRSQFILKAARAVRTNGVWTFFNATLNEIATEGTRKSALQTNVLAMPEYNETPADIQREIKVSGFLGPGGASRISVSLTDILIYLREHPDLSRQSVTRLLTELHARLAAPGTCLVVVLIAIPFGAASGRRNLFFGVAGSIFICFAYFVIQKVSIALGSHGHLPAWLAAWLPNMVFGAAGLGLMTRVR